MMRKVYTVLLAGFIIFTMSLQPLQAVVNSSSLTSYGEGSIVVGNCKGKNVSLNDELTGLMVATQSQLIINGNSDFKIEVGNMAKEFEVIDDIDNDGFRDVAVYVDVDDDYDDFKVISSKTSKVLFSTKYSYKTLNDDGDEATVNSTIRQIAYDDKLIYLIYDYHLTAISVEDFKVKFDYVDEDNIWKMVINENQIIFTNQLGQVTSIDKTTGSLNYQTLVANPIMVKPRHFDNEIETKLNTWDLLVVGDKLYVTSDDGGLYLLDLASGTIENNIILNDEILEQLKNELSNGYYSNNYVPPIGIKNSTFMAMKMQLVNDGLMLVTVYLGDQGQTGYASENKIKPMMILVDLASLSVKSTMNIEQYNLTCSEAVIGTYDNQDAIIVPSFAGDGKLRLLAYSIDSGTFIGQRDLGINIPDENVKILFSKQDNRYLLQVVGGSSMFVSGDLKRVEYLGNAKVVSKLADVSDGTLVTTRSDSKITQIKKLGLGGKDDVLISIDVPSNYQNNGFEAINYDEKYNQILSLVNETNANGEVVASHIVIMNLNDGSIIADKKVLLEKGRDENNKYYERYLIGESVKYFIDMNNDGKLELLVDDSILDGAGFTFKSVYNKSFEGAQTIIEVGDLNNDGIGDLVNVGETEMRLYYSSKNGYEVTYQKTNIAKSYDKNLQNNIYVKDIGDLDRDGINEFVINGYNDRKCQYYQVINGKDLSVRFALLENGVYDSGESFKFDGIDYNRDGIRDIIYCTPYQYYQILSGKDGKMIYGYSLDQNYEDNEMEPSSTYPIDNLVELNIYSDNKGIVEINDINDDGINEWAWLKYSYDYDNGRDEGTSLKVLDGSNFEEIKAVKLENKMFSFNPIVPIVSQDKLIYRTDELSQIYDYKNDKLVAGLSSEIAGAKTLNNGEIQLEDNSLQLFSFSDKCDFELVDFDNKKISNGNLTVNYTSDKSGLMSVYDQGKLIEKTTSKSVNLKLLSGHHTLKFSYNDGHGKITHYTTTINVEKSSVGRYLTSLLAMIIVAGGFGLVFYPKYRLLKKAGVKRG